MRKEIRLQFHRNFSGIKLSVSALFQDWLLTTQKGKLICRYCLLIPDNDSAEEPEFQLIRKAYLPEIILAYNSVLHFAGLSLSRDNFLECMDLSTVIAAEDSDLAELFMKTGRMPELVAALAGDSAALLFSTAPGKSRPGPSKKLREKGWTRDLWNITL